MDVYRTRFHFNGPLLIKGTFLKDHMYEQFLKGSFHPKPQKNYSNFEKGLNDFSYNLVVYSVLICKKDTTSTYGKMWDDILLGISA